jgi:hypothetical protein
VYVLYVLCVSVRVYLIISLFSPYIYP